MENPDKKFYSLLFLLFFVVLISGCDRAQDVDLKDDVETRQDVFDQILNDEELFTEFVGQMRESDQSMEWMRANRPMMRSMYSRRQVQALMRENPETLDSLMEGMMTSMQKDTTRIRQRMRQNWFRMMEEDTMFNRQMQERFRERRGGQNQ